MTKKKRLITILLAAICAVSLALGIYFLCNSDLFVLADDTTKGENLTVEKIDANSKYLIGSYIDAFGVPASSIKKSETDGDTASGSLSGIFDRNFNTAWRSKVSINETATSVTATFYFEDPYELEGFLYRAENGGRGYFSNLAVTYHTANDYDSSEFRSFGTVESTATGDTVHVKFDKATVMTAIRLEWRNAPSVGGAKNASASEIVFLQPEDKDVQDALDLFSDYAQLTLKETVDENSVKEVRDRLQQKSAKIASWESFLDPLLNRASQIYKKALSLDPRREMGTAPDSTNLLGRHGDVAGYARNTLKFSNFGTNRQATGVSARPGDVLIIYVEAEPEDPLPSIIFTQHWGTAMRGWKSDSAYSLHRGRNIIVTPTLHYYGCHDNNGEPVPSGGPIYLVNPYLPKEDGQPEGRNEKLQSANVKIYIEGGTAIPTFRKGGDVDAYLSDLAEYAALVEEDKMANGDTLNYTMVDVTEVVCDRMTLTVQATRGDYYYNELGYDPQEACENWDDYVKKLLMFDGVVFLEEGEKVDSDEFQAKLDSVYGKYDSRNEWLTVNIRLMQPWGAAYAAPEHVGIQVGWDGSGLIGQGWGWGYSHEIGHMLDISERLVGECSNNMISKFDETVLEKTASRGDFAQNLAQLSPDDHMDSYFNTNRLNFTIWWLIESYFPGYWTTLENYYRYYNLYDIVKDERKQDESINATEKQIFLSSIVTGIDLSYYFERWGYNLSGGNPIFVYENSSELFRRMMARGRELGLFSDKFQPKLWYLDAAEWWERYDNKSYAASPSFSDGFEKGSLYSETDKAPSILNITKSGNSYSLMIDLDEKFGQDGHLGYEVQAKEAGENDDAWRVVGFTYGRIFSDSHTYATSPTYRLVAYDRALHHSAPGEAKTHDSVAITDVCRIEKTGNMYNSVAEAVAAASDGDTIILLKSSFESGILINKSLTIKTENGTAGDTIKITKSGAEPIFRVVEQSVTVETEEGSNVYQEENHFGKLTLIGVVLDGFGIESDGSLVHVEAGELTIQNSLLEGGVFKYGNNSMGGALRFEGGKLHVTDTTFENNSARIGGAVCITHRANSEISFEGCTFKGNSAYEGGGLYNTSTVKLTSCTFENNSADSVGGGFANVSGGVMEVHNCTFTGNRTNGRGGGFYADGRVDLFGGTFTGNEAKTDGAAFCYWRSSSAARPLYVHRGDGEAENQKQLPNITGNRSENGAAVTLHGQVEHFEAEIRGNDTKYAVRLGGASVNLDGGTIDGGIFREAAGKVTLNAESVFHSDSAIKVYTDSQEAHLVILSAGTNVTFSDEYAKKFIGENGEKPTHDTERNEIVIELESYTVTFNIKIDEDNTQTETRHFRPGSTFTFESFTGNKDQKWYVTEWREGEEITHRIGEKFEVTADVVFDAVVSEKFRIEFKVEGTYEGVNSQTFYAMPGEKYTLPKFDIDGFAHNGWEIVTETDGKPVTKMYQPAKSFRAAGDRTYTAVIVKKFTVQYMVEGKDGLPSLYFATKSFAYGSKLTWESCDDEQYVPFGGFIEGYYIRNSDGSHSENLVDFNTYTVTSDLVLMAKVIEKTSMICYMIYEDGVGETDGHFVGESLFSYIAYDIDYSLNLLPIPEGYHLTRLTFNSETRNETLDPATANGYTFKVVDYSYLVVAYVEKNTYTISYECNEVPFRTETMPYGATLTFTDPTNSLLKEAVRGYEDLDENSKYSFSSYQLVSANPRAGEPDEPDKIRLNIMLGDQITVTENLTINIIAYIEGHEYEADNSAGNTVEEWRTENRKYVNDALEDLKEKINDPTLDLSQQERTDYIAAVIGAASKAIDKINTTVSFEEMRTARLQFEETAKQTLSDATVRAAKNAAKSTVASAMNAALKAFDGMEDEDGATAIQDARKEIEQIAKDAQSSIESNFEGKYDQIVADALNRMQEVVIKCNGDRLAMQKANAITTASGFAERAKRRIEALPYLSTVMKGEFAQKIDARLETAVKEINAVTPQSSTEGDLTKESEEITGYVFSLEQDIEGFLYEAQKYSDSKLDAVEGDTAPVERGKALMDYAAAITEEINTLLEERSAEIRADGIIFANDELITKLTAFAEEKTASVASILREALSALAEIVENEDGKYKAAVAETVKTAKTRIGEQKNAVVTDFDAKIKEAEQTSRSEIIALHITVLAENTLRRFEELTIDNKDALTSQLQEARERAEEVVRTAENITEINTAVTAFHETVAKLSFEAEKASALAVITATVKNSDETLKRYDFLEQDWIQTYTESIASAAEAARTQIGTAAKAEDVIAIGNTFLSAVQTTLDAAQLENETKGAAAKVTALEGIDDFANDKGSEIDSLGFLTEEEKLAAKAELRTVTDAAKKNVSSAASKQSVDALVTAYENGVAGTDGVLTKAQTQNHTAETEKKNAASTKAKDDAQSLKTEIDSLGYLTKDDRDTFNGELDAKLKQALGDIEAALTVSGVDSAAATFGHDLNALRARAMEKNNATRGDRLASAMTDAINEVSKKIDEIRLQVAKLAFLTEETAKPFSDRLGDALHTATLAIRAAKQESEIPTLQSTHVAIVEGIGSEAAAENTARRAQAVEAGKTSVNEAADAARAEIEALTHLGTAEKQAFTGKIDSAKTRAASEIEAAETPAAIDAAVKAFRSEIAAESTKAKADDALAEVRSGAEKTLSEEDNTREAINALGFLTEEEKREYLDQVTSAATAAKGSIESAVTADDVNRALSAFTAQIGSAQSAAEQKNGERETARKTEKKELTSKTAKEFYSVIEAQDYITKDEKELYHIRITQLVQDTHDKIKAAKDIKGIEDAYTAFQASLDELKGVLGKENEASKQASIQSAIDAVDSAAKDAREALDALRGKFLTESEIQTYLQNVESKVTSAKTAIQGAATVEAVDSALASCIEELQQIRTQAAETEAEKARTAKNKESVLTQQYNTAKAALDGSNSLSDNEREAFRAELESAVRLASTSILDALNQGEIDSALSTLGTQISDIRANATLRNAKNDALKKANEAAQAAESAVSGLDSLSDERKETYRKNIESQLSSAQAAIESAENAEDVTGILEALTSSLDSATQGAEKEAQDQAFAERKDRARADVTAQSEAAKQEIDKLEPLDKAEKDAFKAKIDALVDVANAAVAGATDENGVQSALDTLTSSLAGVKTEAQEANETQREQLEQEKRERLSKLQDLKDDLTSIVTAKAAEEKGKKDSFTFLDADDITAYTSAIDGALQIFLAAIQTAETEEKAYELKAAFDAAVLGAQNTALTKNTERKQAAKDEAGNRVTTMVEAAKTVLRGHGFIALIGYQEELDLAADSARADIQNAERKDEIDTAVTTLENKIASIKADAEAENRLATESAKSDGRGEVSDRRTELNEKLAALGFISAEKYADEIDLAVQTANAAVDSATDNRAIGFAVTDLVTAFNGILQRAEEENAREKTAAVEAAGKDIAAEAEKVRAAVSALAFLHEADGYLTEIDTAAENGEEMLRAAQSSADLADMKAEILGAIAAVSQKAEAEDEEIRTAEVNAAKETVKEAKEAAEREIGALGFAESGKYDVAAYAAKATTALDAAESREEIETALSELTSDLKGAVEGATAAHDTARAAAIQDAKAEVENKTSDTEKALSALGFIDAETYQTEIASAHAAATSAIEGAAAQQDIAAALQTLTETLAAIDGRAKNENELAKSAAVNSALRELETEKREAEEKIDALRLLTDKNSYKARLAAAASAAETLLSDPANAQAVEDARAAALAEFEKISSDAQEQHDAVLHDINTAIEAALEALRALKERIEATIGSLGFLYSDPSVARMAIDERTKESFLSALEAAYQTAVNGLDADSFTSGSDVESYLKRASAAMEQIQTDAETVDHSNETFVKGEAQKAIDEAKAEIENLLDNPELPAERRAEYQAELDKVVNDAETALNGADSFAAVQGSFVTFQEGVDLLEEMIQHAVDEDAPVQIVVEGIRAIGRDYDGTDAIAFDTAGVVYRNALTGEQIPSEFTSDFVLTVTGRLSDYSAGKQIALITSISLKSSFIDSGEFALALSGQQAFAEVEIEKTRLIVRVTEDGSVVYEGFVNGEDESVLTGELVLDRNGNVVTPRGLESANYEIVFESATVGTEQGMLWLWITIGCLSLAAAGMIVAGTCIRVRARRKRQ